MEFGGKLDVLVELRTGFNSTSSFGGFFHYGCC